MTTTSNTTYCTWSTPNTAPWDSFSMVFCADWFPSLVNFDTACESVAPDTTPCTELGVSEMAYAASLPYADGLVYNCAGNGSALDTQLRSLGVNACVCGLSTNTLTYPTVTYEGTTKACPDNFCVDLIQKGTIDKYLCQGTYSTVGLPGSVDVVQGTTTSAGASATSTPTGASATGTTTSSFGSKVDAPSSAVLALIMVVGFMLVGHRRSL